MFTGWRVIPTLLIYNRVDCTADKTKPKIRQEEINIEKYTHAMKENTRKLLWNNQNTKYTSKCETTTQPTPCKMKIRRENTADLYTHVEPVTAELANDIQLWTLHTCIIIHTTFYNYAFMPLCLYAIKNTDKWRHAIGVKIVPHLFQRRAKTDGIHKIQLGCKI